ncbi:MAG: glycerol dehydrogenase [Shinella sp.]|nr:glycerol dehydrogenase [Shinella sp.]
MLVKADRVATVRGARFPGRYIQGAGAIARLGEEAKGFGGKAIVLLDNGVFDLLKDDVEASFANGPAVEIVRHGGECSETAIAALGEAARAARASVIVGAGGGKALDTAKAAARDVALPVIVFPTIAASDAPCSALAVVYNEDGTVAYDTFLPSNPDLVLVDTALIAKAPARFLAAGIGDALATFYEAESCRLSGAFNCMKMPGVSLAYEVARFCRETIFEYGAEALAECDAGQAGPALERVVEANILLSGIGFESGGVAAAHAVHHGLCELDDVHHHLHGEKVAVGVLAGLKLHGMEEEYERVRRFCLSVRLPTRLADIGIHEVTHEKLTVVARRACRAGEIIHNEPMPVTEEMVVAALKALAWPAAVKRRKEMKEVEAFSPGLLSGKTVVVSGGTSGIGLSLAKGFTEAGASVIATGSSQARLSAAKAHSSDNLRFELLDVRDGGKVAAFFSALERLDVLVNCQGVARPDAEWEEETFLDVMDINLSSAMRLSRAALPLLAESGGSIVNFASMLSYLADESVPAYTASKTGIVGLTRALAHKYGRDGVRVNAVAPGYHRTDMTKPLWSVRESEKKISDRSALKRWGTTEDLVGPVLFLASPAAAFVTGVTLPVDGGYHIG